MVQIADWKDQNAVITASKSLSYIAHLLIWVILWRWNQGIKKISWIRWINCGNGYENWYQIIKKKQSEQL